MDDELKYFSGQQLAVDELEDGFYIALQPAQMDIADFIYFRIDDAEDIPSEYMRVLKKYTNNVLNLMAMSSVVLFGVVSYGYFRIVQVMNELTADEIYPAVVRIPKNCDQEGQYLVIMSKARLYIDQDQRIELIKNDQGLTLDEWLQNVDYNMDVNIYAEGETVQGIPGYLKLNQVADEDEDY